VQLAGLFDPEDPVRGRACESLTGSLRGARIAPPELDNFGPTDSQPCWRLENLYDWQPIAIGIREAVGKLERRPDGGLAEGPPAR
jgi:hypothetical protein